MAKGPESRLYQRLKENLPRAAITRLESKVGLGIPDCLIALEKDCWVMLELKVVNTGKKVKLSPHQIAFQLKHASLGMPTFILVHHQKTGTTRPADGRLLLYHGAQAEEVYRLGIDAKPLDSWRLDAVLWDVLRYRLLCGDDTNI